MDFEIDEIVLLRFTRKDVLSFRVQKGQLEIDVRIKHIAGADGEHWWFETLDGIQFTINPLCSDFVGVVK